MAKQSRRDEEPPMPMWMAAIDKFKPAKSLGRPCSVLIGTLGLAIPIGIYFFGGETAAETFAELRHWLAINNATIIAGADGGLEPS